ncbi:NADH dehydrogenase [ubiquinone] 1 beta subcomplex subunit 3 [Phlebotomus papatasi]|uniref:NADH dehydrogenase [ubiquinone] 1 beta subcomplex subunit 3 n=1 Tax=Phlebotomus papatasi TaxID=29031 RepID=A0A1B0GPS8_PHLPP|nr:NADH dehydrogenase [ubiquinone] 1 beta subcomplex subunit 3 [Phlebotomus papatasi]XP_055705043.1 NADH dehydrogenase [ubiquinone] 1 beta subcomplex subunit 3 [Phlebotomus papatasi]
MGGHHLPKVPDASIYKVEDVPELLEVQKSLSRQGLRDPWLRNEVWRYDVKQFGTHRQRLMSVLFRGFGIGFAAFLATIGIEKAFNIDYTGGRHAHGHGHGEEGHH